MKPRTYLLLGSLLVMLGACGSLPKPSAAPALFDFGIAPTSTVAPIPVKLGRVEAVPGLEHVDMRYRLAYRNPAQVFAYTESRWAAAPADLLAQRLRHYGFSPTASDCNLRVVLETFDQVFDSPTSSHVVIGLRADVINGGGRSVRVVSTQIVKEHAASSADAKGGMTALSDATDDAIAALRGWVAAQGCGGL